MTHFTQPGRPAGRARLLLTVLLMLIAAAGTLYGLVALNSSEDDEGHEDTTATDEVICRADGEFVAGFMSPQAEDAETHELLAIMQTDALTFGGRTVPVEASDYPAEVAAATGERQPYKYTVQMHWEGIELDPTDQVVHLDQTAYGIIETAKDSVVITESQEGADVFYALTRTAAQREPQAFLGPPVPQMRTGGDIWLPDDSYSGVVDGFAEKFVAAYHQRGADGFYLAMEMPLTDAGHWDPVTDYYARQTAMINNLVPGATVVIAPYFEGRKDRETLSPQTAADGYENLLELANGTHLVVAPQDGLGLDTTALDADSSQTHEYTVEDYFAALQAVDPQRLYVTIEAMQPGGGSPDTREPTTRARVEAQLDATAPYVQGAIGFQWSGPNAMTGIAHIGRGACAAGPGQLP